LGIERRNRNLKTPQEYKVCSCGVFAYFVATTEKTEDFCCDKITV